MSLRVVGDEFYFYDAQFVLGLLAVFGFEEIKLASCGFCHLYNTAKGILILTGSFQSDGDFICFHPYCGYEMNVAQTALSLTAPYERIACKDLKWVTAQTPTGKL